MAILPTEKALREKLDSYVSARLIYPTKKLTRPTLIHDSVHGTNSYMPHEMAMLDQPLLQRLRRISQTDVASFVFPAGNHNRFEHTVGVTAIAGKMCQAIFAKNADLCNNYLYNPEYFNNNCRFAAILHDCGHGPFSHQSEVIYGPVLERIKKENPKLEHAVPHEILSYLIATGQPMRDFNRLIIKGMYNIDIDLDLVGEMIVGYINPARSKIFAFLVDIINGAFDADKLDYLLRDAHSTGVMVALDVPRLMYTLDVVTDDEDFYHLAIDISGVSAIEEIIFNKMMLTSIVYQHQKVRAAGCVLKTIFSESKRFNTILDYLTATDDEVFTLSGESDEVSTLLDMLKTRNFPKRALCLAGGTMEESERVHEIAEQLKIPAVVERVKDEIAAEVMLTNGIDIPTERIWIDMPSVPRFHEINDCFIKSGRNERIRLSDVSPTDKWVAAFSESKWRGFIYTMQEYQEQVAHAAVKVLEKEFGIHLNKMSLLLCKIDN